MTWTPIHLKANGPRDVSLMCGDEDLIKTIPGVSKVTLECTGKTAPTVTIETLRPFTYEGLAEIHVLPSATPVLTVLDFLNGIDPKDLEAAALEVTGGLNGPTVGESFLIALKALAESLDGA